MMGAIITTIPEHLACEAARAAWFNGWELDFKRRRYVRLDPDEPRIRLVVERDMGNAARWVARIESTTCGCAFVCAIAFETSAEAMASADSALRRMNEKDWVH